MADTITIDLDSSSAQSSLDKLVDGLDEAQSQTSGLAEAGQEVIDSQTKQVALIKENTTDWKTFATVATDSVREVSVASLELAGDVLHLQHGFQTFALDTGKKTIETLLNIAEMTVKYTLVAKGAATVIGAVKGKQKEAADASIQNTEALKAEADGFVQTAAKATAFGLVINTLTGQWESSQQAATSAGSAYAKWRLGLAQASLVAVGVVAAVKAGDAFSETMKEVRDETEGATGDFDRLKNAAAGAAYNLTRPFSEVAPALKSVWGQVKEDFSQTVKQIGEDAYEYFGVKKAVDYGEKNLRQWGTFFENWIDEARGNFVKFEDSAYKAFGFKGDDNAARYTEEAKSLRELSDWHEKMNRQREQEREGYDLIRKVTEDYAKGIEDAAHAEELATIKTLSDVAAKEQAIRRLAGEQATAGKFTKEDAERLAKDLEALEQRRTAIVREETDKRIESERAAAESAKRELQAIQSLQAERTSQGRQTAVDAAKANGATDKQVHEQKLIWIEEERQAALAAAKSQTDAVVANAEADKKRIQEVEGYRQDEIKRSQEARKAAEEWQKAQSAASNEIARARAEFADSMELQSLELKRNSQKSLSATTKAEKDAERARELAVANELHQKRLEIIERETKREFDAAKTKEDKLRAVTEGQKKRLQEESDFAKKSAQDAHDHKMRLAEEEARKADEKKKAAIDAAKPMAEQLIGRQSTQDRIRALQEMRAAQAGQRFAADNQGLARDAQTDPAARRQFMRQQQQAEMDARRQAMKDARTGNVTEGEQAAVANSLAQKTLGQMAKGGKLSQDLVSTQQQAIQVIAQQQANTDALARQVQQLQGALTALQGAANPNRFRAQQGGQRG